MIHIALTTHFILQHFIFLQYEKKTHNIIKKHDSIQYSLSNQKPTSIKKNAFTQNMNRSLNEQSQYCLRTTKKV